MRFWTWLGRLQALVWLATAVVAALGIIAGAFAGALAPLPTALRFVVGASVGVIVTSVAGGAALVAKNRYPTAFGYTFRDPQPEPIKTMDLRLTPVVIGTVVKLVVRNEGPVEAQVEAKITAIQGTSPSIEIPSAIRWEGSRSWAQTIPVGHAHGLLVADGRFAGQFAGYVGQVPWPFAFMLPKPGDNYAMVTLLDLDASPPIPRAAMHLTVQVNASGPGAAGESMVRLNVFFEQTADNPCGVTVAET